MSDLEPSNRHVAGCAVWVSPDPEVPCDCGTDDLAVDMPLLRPDPGSLADHLDHTEAAS
jgi:hypothetical protein